MKTRRRFLINSISAGICTGFPLFSLGKMETAIARSPVPARIAFGSCCKSWKPQGVWDDINQTDPDLFLFLGDVIYTDESVEKNSGIVRALDEAYRRFSEVREFRRFRERIPVLAVWDDHDYGLREGGADFNRKDTARELFLDFWKAPKDDPRRSQVGGIYASYEYGPPGRRVQIILPDTRFGRSPLLTLPKEEFEQIRSSGFGPYRPNTDQSARMLHDIQWAWLERQLRRPAQLRLICSSVPFAAGFRGWESWANFPLERARLISLIEETSAEGVVFLSGDIHYGELSCETRDVPYPIWDLTSSGLTHFWPTPGPNSNRHCHQFVNSRNFGLVHMRWDIDDPLVILEIRDINGRIMLQHTLSLNALKVPSGRA